MQLTNPLGLIALIGIPILILGYIIRSKYAEQTVQSTFLWTLSERFIKRREYWSGLPFPSPRNLPNPEIDPGSPAWPADSLPSEPPGKLT